MAVCSIVGNSDFYGLGIRLGFYLQWYGVILASYIASKEVPSIRLSLGLFISATFLALVIQIVRDTSSLQDPTRYPLKKAGPLYIILNFLLIAAVAAFEVWYWIALVPTLSTLDCEEYGFLFAQIQLNEQAFQVFNAVLYFILLFIVIILLLSWVLPKDKTDPLLDLIKGWQKPRRRLRGNDKVILQSWNSIINVLVISTIVAATELTIQWNQIDGVNSLSSAGQTIPFVIGIGAVIRILYASRPKKSDLEEGNRGPDDPAPSNRSSSDESSVPGNYPPIHYLPPQPVMRDPPPRGIASEDDDETTSNTTDAAPRNYPPHFREPIRAARRVHRRP